MKPSIVLILLLLSFNVHSQEFNDRADHLAIYEITYQPDSTDTDSKKTESMRLYLGKDYSLFASSGKIVRDSLMANRDPSNKSMAAFARLQKQIPKTNFSYLIYKGIPSGKITFAEKIVKDRFRYQEDKNIFDWKILADTKSMFGYQVQKAETFFRGRKYTAWFTPEIPISDGPYKFQGLPGLILQISDDSDHFSFSLTEFRSLNESRSISFDTDRFRLVERSEFLAAKANFSRDPIGALAQHGITMKFEPGQREKLHKEHLQELKSKNNPIELE